MALSFFEKKIEDLEYIDVYNLACINKIPESYNLDYKSDYPKNEKLAKLMCSFANASGGYIVVGIEEVKVYNKNTGVPDKIVGVDKTDHTTKVTNIAISHSQPKIIPHVQVIELNSDPDKVIVVIKIDESIEPIMYYSKNDSDSNKFFIRINDKREPADYNLLKKLFRKETFLNKINEIEQAFFKNLEEIIKYIHLADESRDHILLGATIIPFNKNLTLVDIDSSEMEHFIKDLADSLRFGNPYTGMVDFSNFLRSFKYLGQYFKSQFERNTTHFYNYSNIEIYRNGVINNIIIYNVPSVKDIKPHVSQFFEPSLRKRVDEALFLSSSLISYIIMMWLKLVNLIYERCNYNGRFKFILRILGEHEIVLCENFVSLGNSYDIKVEDIFYAYNLSDREGYLKTLRDLLKEILRFFGFELKNIDDGLKNFEDSINNYIDSIFK